MPPQHYVQLRKVDFGDPWQPWAYWAVFFLIGLVLVLVSSRFQGLGATLEQLAGPDAELWELGVVVTEPGAATWTEFVELQFFSLYYHRHLRYPAIICAVFPKFGHNEMPQSPLLPCKDGTILGRFSSPI